MTLARFTVWTLLVGTGFAISVGAARAQPPVPKPDSGAPSALNDYRGLRGGIPNEELKAARENFTKFAKYYAEVVAHPHVYKAPQEFKAPSVLLQSLAIDGPHGILVDLNRFMLEPAPGNKAGPDQAVYIRELGAALDAVLKNLIENDPEPIVRVNAARVLAHVCKGGSSAHYPTLTALIASPNTRTEVKHHLLHAAGNLLAAYDPVWLKTRNHVDQTENPKAVGALVKALDDCVNTPSLLLAGLPDNKADQASPDQLAVLGVVRRQAIKALAQVRFAVVAGPDGKTPMYPAYTLARVALGDPALLPAPGPADAAEAVIGLCNMAPGMVKGDRVITVKYDADVALEAITTALVNFAGPRAANAFDRSLPWRSYALRIADGLRTWRPLFDPELDPGLPNKYDASRVPAVVEEFYKDVVPKVLAPMDKVDGAGKPDIGAKVDIEGLRNRLGAIRANPKRGTTLFPGVPQTTIDFAPAKK